MKYILFLCVAVLLTGCGEKSGFEVKKLTIITKNAEQLAKWYEKNLDFDRSLENDLLYHKNLTILLEENDKAKHRDSTKVAYNLDRLPGFFKIGFLTNQFDNLVESLRENEVKFVGGVVTDKIQDRRMLVIKDPDGNRIQLFEDRGPHKLKPYLVSLIAEHIGEQEKWYQMKLPVATTHNLDVPDQEIYIRVLEGSGFLIELIETTDRPVKSELDQAQITGFYEIIVDGAKSAFETDHEGNRIISP